MTRLLLLCLIQPAICAFAMELENEPMPGVKQEIPELRVCAQVIVVITETWGAGPARLRLFERRGGEWIQEGAEIRTAIGKKGIAWGIGLHGSYPSGAEVKREGDGKSPAGVFE